MNAVNPASGERLETPPRHDSSEVERRLQSAARAFLAWRQVALDERTARVGAAASVLRRRQGELARLVTTEMGKPITQSEAEVEKCAWVCEHVAGHAASDLAFEPIATDASRSGVRFDPIGPILAVMPWNFPLWQVFRAAAPALAAGNVMVLKHASNVPGCALAVESVLAEAGLPPGAFTTLLIGAEEAEAVVEHPVIAGLTVTGSEAAGSALAQRAGKAMKKVVLELGGSDPFIVLADADLDRAAGQAVAGRIVNTGQSCIAAKRFIVEAPAAERFERLFAQRMARLRVGDPMDRATEIGPLAREDLLHALERQVRDSVSSGARLLTGGSRVDRPGYYYAPTVLSEVRPGMPAFDEETFGPVAAVTRARDAGEAIVLANSTRFGLGASLWTADAARGEALAAQIEAGSVFVNDIVKSDPRMPFGGVKRSGHGRELGTFGIREFVNVKTVWVK